MFPYLLTYETKLKHEKSYLQKENKKEKKTMGDTDRILSHNCLNRNTECKK